MFLSQAQPGRKKMILVIDVGNTTIGIGGMSGRRPLWTERCLSASIPKERVVFFERLKEKRFAQKMPSGGIICSVVPELTERIVKECRNIFGMNMVVVGKDLLVPMRNQYVDPEQVGQDRLVGAYAARERYGAPVVVIDFGTAITFDVVSSSGSYEGGVIIPGLGMSVESLYSRTALLPKVHVIRKPRSLIGKTTEDSILCGIIHGYGALCDGMLTRMYDEIKARSKVILTGGQARLLKGYLSGHDAVVDEHLVFSGLAMLWRHGLKSLPQG
jgi:type III pantothenate kinase